MSYGSPWKSRQPVKFFTRLGQKNAEHTMNNNSLACGDFIFPGLVQLCVETGSDFRDDQLFQNKFQNFFFRARGTTKRLNNVQFWSSFIVLLSEKCSFVNSATDVRNIEKTMGRPDLAKLAGLKSAIFSQGPVGSPLSNVFKPKFFRLHFD